LICPGPAATSPRKRRSPRRLTPASRSRSRAMKRFVPVMLVSALLLVMALPARAATGAQDLRIGDYVLVSKTRIGPLHWQLAYRATLANRGATNLGGARAELARILDFLIVDGQLSFGPVAAGKSVAGSDTFTLRSAM